jgi:hypothetical protein
MGMSFFAMPLHYTGLQGPEKRDEVYSPSDFCYVIKRSGEYEMKGFIGVTVNDWFAFLSQSKGLMSEFLTQTVLHNNGGWRFGYLSPSKIRDMRNSKPGTSQNMYFRIKTVSLLRRSQNLTRKP